MQCLCNLLVCLSLEKELICSWAYPIWTGMLALTWEEWLRILLCLRQAIKIQNQSLQERKTTVNSRAEFAQGLWAVVVAWGQHVRGRRACLSLVSILRDSWGTNSGPEDGKKKTVYLGRPCQNKAINPHSPTPGFSIELPKLIFCDAPQLSKAPSPPGLRLQQLLINVWNQHERTRNFQGLNTEFLKVCTLLWPSPWKAGVILLFWEHFGPVLLVELKDNTDLWLSWAKPK